MGSVIIETMIQDADGLVEVPKIVMYDLRTKIFEYIKFAKDNSLWEGRTNTRISNLSKSIINTVNKRYRIGSKNNTTTSLLFIGCYKMQGSLDQEQWDIFDKINGCIDENFVFLPSIAGTDRLIEYNKMKSTLRQSSELWKGTKNTVFQIDDNENDVFMNYYNDERFGHQIDMFSELFGYTRREVANLAIIYAVHDCDIFTNTHSGREFNKRLEKAVKFNTDFINMSIREFNSIGYSILDDY